MKLPSIGVFAFGLFLSLAFSLQAAAHCDTTKGPVVRDARSALEAGNINLVLHWVRPEDESAVRSAFEHTIQVRTLGPAATELADRYFFETLVRIHRAGEGAPYTGLTDNEPEPVIATIDHELDRGSFESLEEQLVTAVRSGLHKRFAAARDAKGFRPGDIAAGRAYVAAYVPLTHWAEGVFTAANGTEHHDPTKGHGESPHAALHDPTASAHSSSASEVPHRAAAQHVSWILVGLLAVTALVEGAFLVRRSRSAAA